MKNTWRFVVKVVGASLALAGLVCLVVGYWDKLAAGGSSAVKAIAAKCPCCGRKCSEFDDYDDDLLYE